MSSEASPQPASTSLLRYVERALWLHRNGHISTFNHVCMRGELLETIYGVEGIGVAIFQIKKVKTVPLGTTIEREA